MPTVRLLRTDGFGYSVWNLTSTVVSSYVTRADLTSQVNVPPGQTIFSVGMPFVAGSLEVFLQGINQTGVTGYITETPGAGTFTLSVAPLLTQIPLVVRFIAA